MIGTYDREILVLPYTVLPQCTGTYWYVPVCTDLPNPVQVYRIPDASFNTAMHMTYAMDTLACLETNLNENRALGTYVYSRY